MAANSGKMIFRNSCDRTPKIKNSRPETGETKTMIPNGSSSSDYSTIMTSTEDLFDDDPFKSLDDFATSNNGTDDDDDAVPGNANLVVNSDDDDPWAVLAAAAAGEGSSSTSTDDEVATAAAADAAMTLAHAEGETFAMPDDAVAAAANNNNNNPAARDHQTSSSSSSSSLVDQLRSSTAHLFHEVDAKTGISTRARIVDDQFHISEKIHNFHGNVLLPATAKTVDKTKEIVQEKIAPTVREHWGAIQQRASELGVKERMTMVSSAVGQTWQETTSRVGHWREEQEMRRALANANATTSSSLYGDAGGGSSQRQHHHQLPQNLDVAREKVVEGWNWMSQRIVQGTAKFQQQHSSSGEGGEGVPVSRTTQMRHLDSHDGLPSSFRKD
jgi:hypothetical protein